MISLNDRYQIKVVFLLTCFPNRLMSQQKESLNVTLILEGWGSSLAEKYGNRLTGLGGRTTRKPIFSRQVIKADVFAIFCSLTPLTSISDRLFILIPVLTQSRAPAWLPDSFPDFLPRLFQFLECLWHKLICVFLLVLQIFIFFYLLSA